MQNFATIFSLNTHSPCGRLLKMGNAPTETCCECFLTKVVPKTQPPLTSITTIMAELASTSGLRVLVASAAVPSFSLTTFTPASFPSPLVEFCNSFSMIFCEYIIACVGEKTDTQCNVLVVEDVYISIYRAVESLRCCMHGNFCMTNFYKFCKSAQKQKIFTILL